MLKGVQEYQKSVWYFEIEVSIGRTLKMLKVRKIKETNDFLRFFYFLLKSKGCLPYGGRKAKN